MDALAAHGLRCFGLANAAFPAGLPPQVVPVRCDLSDAAALEEAIAGVAAQTESLDDLITAAGIDAKYRLEEGTVDVWDLIADLNLRAYYLLIRSCLPLLRHGRRRSIVNVSSVNYRLGIVGHSIYSTTKAGILRAGARAWPGGDPYRRHYARPGVHRAAGGGVLRCTRRAEASGDAGRQTGAATPR